MENLSVQIRLDILEMLLRAGSGHPGGSLSETEILIALYFYEMNIDPKRPDMPERDRFILSKGHAAPGLYAVLSRRGFFDRRELGMLRKMGSILQGHPDMKKTPGIDFSSGSLGQGLSVGCGMALGARIAGLPSRVFVLLGDGELNEGQIWEAAMAAYKLRLNNLIAIVDRNHLQLDGDSDEIMPLEPLEDKWRSFGWKTICVDGHNLDSLREAFERAGSVSDVPVVILAETVKGKGVSFMEHDYRWHGQLLDEELFERARDEILKNPEIS